MRSAYRKQQPRIPDKRSVTSYAVWLLARRSYAQGELLKKFRTRFQANEPLFAEVLASLAKLGLQSDQSAAENFVTLHPGWGERRIRMELSRRGISNDIMTETLTGHDDEVIRATAALTQRLHGKPLPTDYAERQKLMAFLGRRGFSLDTIKQVLTGDLEEHETPPNPL